MIGCQNDEDLSFLTDTNASDYVKTIQNPKEKCKFKQMFQNTDPALLDLLKGLLQFNPVMRLTAKEAINSKIFDSIRCKDLQQPSKKQISQKINSNGAFDYLKAKDHKYSISDYKKMLQREVKLIKKMKMLC